MTSDAKIGLLLGLVFIFVIAFIINGLPNLRPQTTRAEVPTNMVSFTDHNLGLAGREQAQVNHEWNTLVDEQETAQAPQEVGEQASPAGETPLPQSQTAAEQDVRFEAPLPGTESPTPHIENPLARIESLLERFTAARQNQKEQTVSTVNMNVPTPAEAPAAIERQPASPTRTEVRPVETTMRSVEQPKPSGTAATRPAGKIYIVGEGESLSTVAKKVYGPDEGNRVVNVNRIYEANKDVVKSVHEVVAGQKLIIPPLPKSQPTANPNKPSDVLSRELFEKVELIGRRATTQTPVAAPVVAAPPSGEYRWYTVQDGDNLWKIASSQLGAGARYEEVAKFNADLLKDAAKVDPGMKIRLPLK